MSATGNGGAERGRRGQRAGTAAVRTQRINVSNWIQTERISVFGHYVLTFLMPLIVHVWLICLFWTSSTMAALHAIIHTIMNVLSMFLENFSVGHTYITSSSSTYGSLSRRCFLQLV